MTWDILIVDEQHKDWIRTKVFLVDTKNGITKILVETRDHYEHLDGCMNPENFRAIVLKMIEIDGEKNEFVDVYDPYSLKPVISLSNWPVDKIAFSKDGNRMYLQAKLETGTPIEAVFDLSRGEKVENASWARDGQELVKIGALLKKRKRESRKLV